MVLSRIGKPYRYPADLSPHHRLRQRPRSWKLKDRPTADIGHPGGFLPISSGIVLLSTTIVSAVARE